MPQHEPWTPERASETIARHQHEKGATLPILHALQAVFGCVPLDAEPLIAEALNVRAETILSYAGWLQADDDNEAERIDAERAILADYRLTAEQQQALISTYRAFLSANTAGPQE